MNFTQDVLKSKKVLTVLLSLVTISTLGACAPAPNNELALGDEVYEEGFDADTDAGLTAGEEQFLKSFQEPSYDEDEMVDTLSTYSHLDPKRVVPTKLLEKAVAYYKANLSKIKNRRYLGVVDFSQHSSRKRFYVVDMNSGYVTQYHMSHGEGSDKNHDGYADRFSNISGSKMSSLGFYRVAETYHGKWGYSVRLDGLSSTNSKARSRAVVLHGSTYVVDRDVRQGRSWGCLVFSLSNRSKIIDMFKGGAIIYAGLSR